MEFFPAGNVDAYMQDILTMLCYLRTLTLKVGIEYILDGRSGDSPCPLTVKVLGKEAESELMVRKDAYTLANLRGSIVVWLTDVCIWNQSLLGLVNAVLESADTNKKR